MIDATRTRRRYLLDEDGNMFVVVAAVKRPESTEERFIIEAACVPLGNGPGSRTLGTLTERERQIAYLLARRATNSEIAREFGISRHTARHHSQSVLDKLGLRSRSQVRAALFPSGVVPRLINKKRE